MKNKQVDEFASSGEFQRAFPSPNAQSPEFGSGRGGAAVDPTNGNVLIAEGNISEFDSSGNLLNSIPSGFGGSPATDVEGRLYVPSTSSSVRILGPSPTLPTIQYFPVSEDTTTAGTLNATVDPAGGGDVTACVFEYGTSASYSLGELPCSPDPGASPPGSNFSVPTAVSAVLTGLTTETTYHYRAMVVTPRGTKYGEDRTYTPHGVVGLRTDPATGITESAADLNGSLVGDGTATHYLFEWGRTSSYGEVTASAPGDATGSPAGPSRTPLSFHLSGLEPFTTYHYRIVATGGSGTSHGEDRVFTATPGVPVIGPESVSEVHADRAVLRAQIDANGAKTTYHFEYVDDEQFQEDEYSSADQAPSPDERAGMGNVNTPVSVALDGLKAGTLYHYRAVADNSFGTGVPSVDRTFRTYKFGFDDVCPNAHVRQQTGAALLFDCRAYELASAANAGGYDVESDLIPGQTPFGGRPQASGPSQLLYGVHNGGIPGTGYTTNHGVDPYVATRGEGGWTTRYVGIPADDPFATGPFGSPVLDADSHANTYVFGGSDLCSPCFADGSTGEPVRLSNGSLVQGMVGSLDPGPGAEPSGYIGKDLSADGFHFVFGSTSKFEPAGNSNGDLSIYDRDLNAGVTHVVSKTPSGETMTGAGIGELDISSSGDRVLFGQLVSTDSAGNRRWHLYMNVGDSDQSIDLMPGNAEGALFDGMSADGTAVYFTTSDTPSGTVGGDGDTSADIFRADVTGGGATVTRVSTGEAGSGETDSCTPAANTKHTYWNTLSGTPNCDVLAVGGGGGVASSGHAAYFFRPRISIPRIRNTNPSKARPTSTLPGRGRRLALSPRSSRARTRPCLTPPIPSSGPSGPTETRWARRSIARTETSTSSTSAPISAATGTLQVRLARQSRDRVRDQRRNRCRWSLRLCQHSHHARGRQRSGESQLSQAVRSGLILTKWSKCSRRRGHMNLTSPSLGSQRSRSTRVRETSTRPRTHLVRSSRTPRPADWPRSSRPSARPRELRSILPTGSTSAMVAAHPARAA